MFAIAARRMGYRVNTFSPQTDTPTGQVADLEITASYDDLDAVREFARGVSVVTFEFENVPAATAEAAARFAPVRPNGQVLHTTQHRLREKEFLRSKGFPVTPFAAIRSAADLESSASTIGIPSILKTAGFGYDGKGQRRLNSLGDCHSVVSAGIGEEMILEALVDFERELSVIGARSLQGDFVHWGVIDNQHRHHILDISIAPANVPPDVASEAIEITRNVLDEFDVVGVLCVEFFLTHSGTLLINELAPRPHNSGHLTFDACTTSQFEQQLRAVCGLPLGSTELLRPAAMANLLGNLWENGEPDWSAALSLPEVKLHLYGKVEAKQGRKMGHLTAMAESASAAAAKVKAARAAL